MVLPIHRLSFSKAGFSSFFTKRPSFLQNKVFIRWIVLACVAIAFIWFGGPRLAVSLGLGPSASGFEYPPFNSALVPHLERPLNPPSQPTEQEQHVWDSRKKEVRNAFKHAWSGYKNIAYPNDELLSISGGSSNKFNGWSVTVFDSLSTMWIMGMRDEFKDAVDSIRDIQFNTSKITPFVPFFETTIRYIGGALSAYALSAEPILLVHAEKIAQILLPAFTGTKSGLPAYSVSLETGEILQEVERKTSILFAEAATCQLEFKYLAKLTGNKEYYEKVENVMDIFYRANETDGLFHDEWFIDDGTPAGSHFTIGPPSDSAYEYLLKQWVQNGDPKARQQYIKSATAIINKLIYQTPTRGLLYVVDTFGDVPHHRLQHLSCYLPGILALGASTLPDAELSPKEKEIHRWAAHGLAYTCAISFADQESGLGPEEMRMSSRHGRRWMEVVDEWESGGRQGVPPGMGEPKPETNASRKDYDIPYPGEWLLRPEAIECIFILWRTTGDVKWRERGYRIFQAIEKTTRTKHGYTTIRGVESKNVQKLDYMPSWFLAETLKYLYLLFDDVNSYPLDRWVFNTEAHPLPIFSWTEKEREAFGID